MTETTTPNLAQVVAAFHDLYPPQLAAGWDASGLVCGRTAAPVRHVHFAVDALAATADEAVEHGAGLLITHHPLLLRGAQFIPDTDYKGHVLHTLIEGQCGLLGAHTNADAAIAGVNEALCDALNLTDRTALAEPQTQELGGEEHPVGTGRVGTLPEPLTLRALSERLADALPATAGGLRIAGRPEQRISRVALCGGAGDSLFEAVRSVGADVYITADLRHHPASEFREQELVRGTECALIDCSHAASESLWLQRAGERLQTLLAERGHSITFTVSSLNTDPWDFTVSTGSAAGSASTR
ncbi:Nif3-like dinuclear metal center hexameric protein [Rothia aeria]|uniref:Nif3-like dinuclear metal center hexameric protein n=1 Tax=Rothia aeria TaxID=172042 RepID=UPI0028E7A74E|nr:Nif3-like dinuclear metal center hexameric protein [Rothia aeria]